MINEKKIRLCLIPGAFCDESLFEETVLFLNKEISSSIYTINSPRSIKEAAISLDAKIGQPSFILGFSLGGWVAQEYAYRYPHKTKGLILVSTTKDTVSAGTKKAMALACNKLETIPLSEMISSLTESYFDKSVDNKVTEKFSSMAQSVGASSAINQYQIILKQNEPVGGPDCSNIPTLILRGGCDKRNPPETQEKLKDQFTHAKLASIPNAGHFIPLEQPKVLAEIINAYLINYTDETA